MAPIGDDTVKALQDLVNKLESRVKELEDKLTHAQSGTKHTSEEGVRMILMGPPGAGMSSSSFCCQHTCRGPPANFYFVGKGTQAPKIKERFSCCHLVCAITSIGFCRTS
jgi:adenylate kinase